MKYMKFMKIMKNKMFIKQLNAMVIKLFHVVNIKDTVVYYFYKLSC
jgi:hypothetical protein